MSSSASFWLDDRPRSTAILSTKPARRKDTTCSSLDPARLAASVLSYGTLYASLFWMHNMPSRLAGRGAYLNSNSTPTGTFRCSPDLVDLQQVGAHNYHVWQRLGAIPYLSRDMSEVGAAAVGDPCRRVSLQLTNISAVQREASHRLLRTHNMTCRWHIPHGTEPCFKDCVDVTPGVTQQLLCETITDSQLRYCKVVSGPDTEYNQ